LFILVLAYELPQPGSYQNALTDVPWAPT
jgi:hypothetical protein